MRVIGLVGSRRKMGNTEILVKEALAGASSEGAEISLLRLTDLQIESCNGCMACVIKNTDCRLKDDMLFLIDLFRQADGLVLGAPSYVYAPAAVVKLITDRLIMLKPSDKNRDKKAVSIVTAGRADGAGPVIPLLNQIPRMAGFEVVGSFLAGSPGPGEVLLDEIIPREANDLGRRLVKALNGEPVRRRLSVYDNWAKMQGREDPLYEESDCCPTCFGKAVEFNRVGEARCLACHAKANLALREGSFRLSYERVSDEERRREAHEHREGWMVGTGVRFQSRREEINALRERYRNLEAEWLLPAGKVNQPA